MPRLRNASIGVKSLISPLVSAAVLISVVGLFVLVQLRIDAGDETTDRATAARAQSRTALLALTKGHAALNRAASLKGQQVEDKFIIAARDEARGEIARAAKVLSGIDLAGLAVDPALAATAAERLKAYTEAAEKTAGAVDVDAFMATMFMTDTHDKYAPAEKAIDNFVAALAGFQVAAKERSTAALRHGLMTIGIAAVLGVALSLGLAVFFARLVSRPIKTMTDAMTALANGDYEIEIPARGRGDEIGAMARAVEVFKENGIEAARLAVERQAEAEAKTRRAQLLDDLTRAFEAKVGQLAQSLSSAATEMEATAQSMSATAEQTNQQSSAVAAASEQTSANVQTVATATEELASSIQEIGRQVGQSARIAGKAAEGARRTDATVQALAEGAQKIGEVMTLIQDIASQTNLLALNATIEAARAGEAGKGFAVVASEVKSLANQTARATEEITTQIAAIQGATKEAVAAIQDIATTIGEVNEIATAIASAVEEQGAATQEIARNVQQAAQGTQEVTSNIAGVQRAATDTGGAAARVLDAAGQLTRQSEELSGEVNRFLEGVKAA